MIIAWDTPIYLYLWLAGMGAGAYFSAFLINAFSGGSHRQLVRLSTYVAVPLAIIGAFLLLVDLGEPFRMWHLFTNFKIISPMSLGTWILLLWTGVSIALIVLWRAEARTHYNLTWAAFALSALLMIYTGVLLSVSSRPLWAATILIPSLFVASSVSTGLGVMVLTAVAARVRTISVETLARLVEADALVIVIELAVLLVFALWIGNPALGGTNHALWLLTAGPLALPFWLGVVLLALVVPLGLELATWGSEMKARGTWLVGISSSICVLLGGLFLRAVIVLGGQM